MHCLKLHAFSLCYESISCRYTLGMQVSPGSQVLLDNAERYGLYLARSRNDTSSTQLLSRKNIGIEKVYMPKVSETADTIHT